MNKKINSGWILCPSKSYPGKFYYFNVLNGEAAWSLNEEEKKFLKKEEATLQKVKGNHLYPEPVTSPDYLNPRFCQTTIKTCFPTLGQATFSKYISNIKKNKEIVWTPNEMSDLVTKRKKMFDQNTQSDQDNVLTCTIPLSKRFANKINQNSNSIGCVLATPTINWSTSPNNYSNIGKESDINYKRKLDTMPLLKESKLQRLQYTNKKVDINTNFNHDSVLSHCNKVENLNVIPNQNLTNLDINDLRYVLKARRRKSFDTKDTCNKITKEYSTNNDVRTVSFNISNNNEFYPENYIEQESAWYFVVDLEVLLDDYDCIKCYMEKDKNCHLYIPSVIQNELKTISVEKHSGRSCVIIARQLLRELGSNMQKLSLPENKEDTRMLQVINCCLAIKKRHHKVVLITKDIKLLHAAKLYKIQAYHIHDIKYNNALDCNFIDTYKNNLFLQNPSDFDPFGISKTVRNSGNYYRDNISDTNKLKDIINLPEEESDIPDITININKLNINDTNLNIERKVTNNLVKNKIDESNVNGENLKKFFFNSIDKRVIKNDNDVNRILIEGNINVTFNNTSKNNKENYININLITKETNDVFDNEKTTDDKFEDNINQFYIKNNIMEHNLFVRFNEWLCTYEQIFEDFFYVVLQKNVQQISHKPPWFLHEGMECLKEIYKENEYIINIIKELLYYYDYSSENGANIKPYNFMKLFGCGFHLVEALEKTSPLYISDIKQKLIYLKDMLERPIEDLPVGSPVHHKVEEIQTNRYNFAKDSSYVLDYVKKHFSEWINYNENNTNQIEQEVQTDNIKVLRTFGRHLNKLTINKSKCLSFVHETDKQTHEHVYQCNDYPKVIRNIQLIDSFEEKIKRYAPLDTVKMADEIIENNDSKYNDISMNDNNEINDSTKDSGFGSNSMHAYSLVRSFLSELSLCFKIIHKFIDESVNGYKDITEENKINLYEKANKTHTLVTEIIDKLKIIIQRESEEGSTLKTLLIKAGDDDKRTIKYRSVIMKCLEQATILKNCLKAILAVINEEEVISVNGDENMHLINIFE